MEITFFGGKRQYTLFPRVPELSPLLYDCSNISRIILGRMAEEKLYCNQ